MRRPPVPSARCSDRFLAWLLPTSEKFPKSHKLTIGDRIESFALDVLEPAVHQQHLKARCFFAVQTVAHDAVDGSSARRRQKAL